MDAPIPTLYAIDADDTIVSVGGAWDAFARTNDAPALTGDAVVGRLLWEFISDPFTTDILRVMVAKCRRGHEMRVPFRCDSPTVERHMQTVIRHLGDEVVQFRSVLIKEVARPYKAFLDATVEHAVPPVTMCSWCKRVADGTEWLDIDAAAQRLALLERVPVPGLTHGICPHCRNAVE